MPVTNYLTVNGQILGESGPNGTMYYDTDPLGSVTMTTDESANVLNEYRYKPYGALLSKTGSAPDPKFTWVGSQGYRATGRNHSEYYVRARQYGQGEGCWTTADQLWPLERRYVYAGASPQGATDPSGTTLGDCCAYPTEVYISAIFWTGPPNPPIGVGFPCGNAVLNKKFQGWYLKVLLKWQDKPKGGGIPAVSLSWTGTRSWGNLDANPPSGSRPESFQGSVQQLQWNYCLAIDPPDPTCNQSHSCTILDMPGVCATPKPGGYFTVNIEISLSGCGVTQSAGFFGYMDWQNGGSPPTDVWPPVWPQL